MLIALSIAIAERRRHRLVAGVIGIAGLARETNLLAAVGLARRPPDATQDTRGHLLCLMLAGGPLPLWMTYLWRRGL